MSRKLVSEIIVSIMVLGPIMRHSDTASGPTKSTGTRIGYTRVSTVAQTLDQQNEALGVSRGHQGVLRRVVRRP